LKRKSMAALVSSPVYTALHSQLLDQFSSSSALVGRSYVTERSPIPIIHPSDRLSILPEINRQNVAVMLSDSGHGRVLSVGYWDHALKLHSLESFKELASASNSHLGAITCIETGHPREHVVVTGGRDGTCRVWVFENPALFASFSSDKQVADIEEGSPEATLSCVRVLCGHDSPISAISYSSEMDLVLSGSLSGLLCVHSARKGKHIRTITQAVGHPVDCVLISPQEYLVAHSSAALKLHCFWLNGQHLATVHVTAR